MTASVINLFDLRGAFMIPHDRRLLVAICAAAGILSSSLAAQNSASPAGAPGSPAADPPPAIVVGMGSGGGLAGLLNGATGSIVATAPVFGAFTGGVRVASGDVDGDGIADIIVAPGPAAPTMLLRIFSGTDGHEIASGYPYGSAYTAGVYVAAGDLTGDGRAEVLTSPDVGGLVRAFTIGLGGASSTLLIEGFPYGISFMGGVRVATGDVNGDGRADVITAPVSGSGNVRVYNSDATLLTEGTPYGPAFTGGIFVAAGDVNGDGLADVITAPATGSSLVRVFNGIGPSTLYTIPAYAPAFTGGVTIAAADVNNDGHAEIITGTASGSPIVQLFNGSDGTLIGGVFAFDSTFLGGVFVAASSPSGIRFTSAGTTTFTTGTAGSFTVTTSAVPTVTSITLAGTLPTGITFTDHGDGTATLAGTGPPGTGGAHTLTFTASNGGADAPVAQTFTLRLEGPPQITSANATTFSVGGAGTFTITTIGFPAPTITSSGALPAGVTLTEHADGTATLSGTPQAGAGGTYPLTITASNGVGPAATQAFTLTVDASPVFTSATSTTFIVGTAGSFAIGATAEPPITSITSSGALPSGITLIDNGGGSATLSGTPAAATTGTYPLTLTAANGVGPSAVQTFTLTVHQAPVITSATTTTFTTGVAGLFDITSTGFPTATLSSTGMLPTGVAFVDNGDGTATLAGTPIAGTGGNYPLTIAATNGVGAPVVQGFTLQVHEAAAITSANATSFNVGAPGTFIVQATGFPTPTTTRGGVALPGGVTWIDNTDGTGTLSGTPDPGTGGTYAITFQANNVAGSSPLQTFTLSVNAPPQITSADNTTFTAGNVSAFAVTTTGVPTPTVSASGTLPAGITFNTITNTLEGTPTGNGTFPLQFTATNGVVPDAVQSFTLDVVCQPITVTSTPPTVPNGIFGVLYAGATFNQSGGGSGGSWSASAPLGGLTLDPATGVLSGTPTNTGVFAATITYSVGESCEGSTPVSITIAPNALGDSYSAGLGNTQIIAGGYPSPTTPHFVLGPRVLGNDAAPPGTLQVIAGTQSTALGGTVTTTADGSFIYTPRAGDTGTDSFTYTVTSNGVAATATVALGLGTQRVWYVNSAAGAGGSGLSNAPFNVLTNVNGAGGIGDDDAPNDFIYLHLGSYASGFEAEAGQTLWGAGAEFAPVANLTIAAATSMPTVHDTVTIAADDVTISSVAIATGPNIGITNTGTPSGLTIKNGVTIATSTATAVQFSGLNSTDGGGPNFGINLESVSSNGSPTAISLTNVNTVSGSFTITGTGAAGSGGIMQNALGNGISLSNTRNVRLDYVAIFDSASNGIFGTGVTNFSMHSSSIQRAGDAVGEHALNFGSLDTDNLLGTATITNSFIADMYQHGITVENVSGTLTMNVLDTLIQNNHPTEGGDGILFQAGGTGSTAATMTLNVGETTADGCVFENLNGDAIQVNSEALSSAGSVATLNVNGCTINTVGGGTGAIAITGINDSINRGIFDIRNNVIQSVEIVGITVFAGDSSELSGVILNNTVQSVGEGILVLGDGGGSGTGSPEVQVEIRNNTLSGQTDIRALRVSSRDGIGGNVQVQLEGNSVAAPIDDEFGGGDGIVVRAEDAMNICLDVQDVAPLGTNNSSAGSGEPTSGLVGYRLDNAGTGTFALQGYAGGPVSALFRVQNNSGTVAESGTFMPGVCTTP